MIGNGLSSSPHNTDGPHAMARFPHGRIGDDVRAQEQLLRGQFGIEELQFAATLGQVTARTFVMPISEDMFFPVRDCEAEQKLTPNSELRVVESVAGHLGLFGGERGYMEQVDRHLGELLEEPA